MENISIHALREEGDCYQSGARPLCRHISIHALREEGDGRPFRGYSADRIISIHALREEGDNVFSVDETYEDEFLSTPSARRATDLR